MICTVSVQFMHDTAVGLASDSWQPRRSCCTLLDAACLPCAPIANMYVCSHPWVHAGHWAHERYPCVFSALLLDYSQGVPTTSGDLFLHLPLFAFSSLSSSASVVIAPTVLFEVQLQVWPNTLVMSSLSSCVLTGWVVDDKCSGFSPQDS